MAPELAEEAYTLVAEQAIDHRYVATPGASGPPPPVDPDLATAGSLVIRHTTTTGGPQAEPGPATVEYLVVVHHADLIATLTTRRPRPG